MCLAMSCFGLFAFICFLSFTWSSWSQWQFTPIKIYYDSTKTKCAMTDPCRGVLGGCWCCEHRQSVENFVSNIFMIWLVYSMILWLFTLYGIFTELNFSLLLRGLIEASSRSWATKQYDLYQEMVNGIAP